MNELNKQIKEIFDEYQKTPALMIQMLFNLLGSRSTQQNKIIQTAILYSMEKNHEWDNIYNYIQKWQHYDFRRLFTVRMRKRVQQQDSTQPIIDEAKQLRRLIDKYSSTISPKRRENAYKQPINPQLKMNSQNLRMSKSQKTYQLIHVKTKDSSYTQKISEKEKYQLPKKLSNVNQQRKNDLDRQNIQKLQSLTGRPPILKKNTTIVDKTKKSSTFSQEELQNNKFQQNSRNSKMNLAQLKERLSLKMNKISEQNVNKNDNNKLVQRQTTNQKQKNQISNVPQANLNQPEVVEPKAKEKFNQSFPPFQQFAFGSNKKSSEHERPIFNIEPVMKMPLQRKVRKIRKNSNQGPIKQLANKSHQFSFMNEGYDEDDGSILHFSEIKKETIPKQLFTSSKKASNFGKNISMQVADPQNPSNKKWKELNQNTRVEQQNTPYFTDQKIRSNEFLSKEQLKVVQQAQCLYLFDNLLKQKKIDVQSIFEQRLAQILNRK